MRLQFNFDTRGWASIINDHNEFRIPEDLVDRLIPLLLRTPVGNDLEWYDIMGDEIEQIMTPNGDEDIEITISICREDPTHFGYLVWLLIDHYIRIVNITHIKVVTKRNTTNVNLLLLLLRNKFLSRGVALPVFNFEYIDYQWFLNDIISEIEDLVALSSVPNICNSEDTEMTYNKRDWLSLLAGVNMDVNADTFQEQVNQKIVAHLGDTCAGEEEPVLLTEYSDLAPCEMIYLILPGGVKACYSRLSLYQALTYNNTIPTTRQYITNIHMVMTPYISFKVVPTTDEQFKLVPNITSDGIGIGQQFGTNNESKLIIPCQVLEWKFDYSETGQPPVMSNSDKDLLTSHINTDYMERLYTNITPTLFYTGALNMAKSRFLSLLNNNIWAKLDTFNYVDYQHLVEVDTNLRVLGVSESHLRTLPDVIEHYHILLSGQPNLTPYIDFITEWRFKPLKVNLPTLGYRELEEPYSTPLKINSVEQFRQRFRDGLLSYVSGFPSDEVIHNIPAFIDILESHILNSDILLAGGAVARTLCNNSQFSDLDLFFYGSHWTTENALEKIKEIEDIIRQSFPHKFSISANANVYNIQIHVETHLVLKIQFILRIYNNKSEILHGFDLPSSAVAYDGNQIYFTQLASMCYLLGINPYIPERKSPSYASRLNKYSRMGFNITIPHLDLAQMYIYCYNNVVTLKLPSFTLTYPTAHSQILDHHVSFKHLKASSSIFESDYQLLDWTLENWINRPVPNVESAWSDYNAEPDLELEVEAPNELSPQMRYEERRREIFYHTILPTYINRIREQGNTGCIPFLWGDNSFEMRPFEPELVDEYLGTSYRQSQRGFQKIISAYTIFIVYFHYGGSAIFEPVISELTTSNIDLNFLRNNPNQITNLDSIIEILEILPDLQTSTDMDIQYMITTIKHNWTKFIQLVYKYLGVNTREELRILMDILSVHIQPYLNEEIVDSTRIINSLQPHAVNIIREYRDRNQNFADLLVLTRQCLAEYQTVFENANSHSEALADMLPFRVNEAAMAQDSVSFTGTIHPEPANISEALGGYYSDEPVIEGLLLNKREDIEGLIGSLS